MNALDLLQVYLQRASADNRDMQVQAPGQNQFPNQLFGLLLHPNAAGIYGRGERSPPAGDIVLPQTGYRDAAARNAYFPRADESPVIRNFNRSTLELKQPRIAMRGLPGAARMGGGGNAPEDGDPRMVAEMMLGRMWRDPSLIGSMNRMQGTPIPPQTTFSETDRIPPEAAGRGYQTLGQPLFDQELGARLLGPQRHQQLFDEIMGGRAFAKEGVWPMQEGDVQNMWPNSPYSSPLNQLLRRGPSWQY